MQGKLLSFLGVLALACTTYTANGQSTAFTYQGALSDDTGPANGLFDMTFELFTFDNGGIAVSTVTNTRVSVSNGLFTTTLDYGAVVFDGTDYWLEIGVQPSGRGGFTTLSPRQPLMPTPSAIHAVQASVAVQFRGPLAASQLKSGTVDDDRLSANVALRGGGNRFSETQVFNNRVGIGTTVPVTRLHVEGGIDAALSRDGYIVLGPTTGSNMVIDDNEIMVRKNGQPSTLFLNEDGGNVLISPSGLGNVGIGRTLGSTVVEKLEVDGRIVVGDSNNAAPRPGAIRWTGSDFEGYNGSQWVSLTLSAPALSAVPVMNMVFIHPGSFALGSPDFEVDRQMDEGPQTTVAISQGFWIGIYEVTQAEYIDVTDLPNPSFFTGDLNRPVEWVSWFDATNYCGILTTQERSAGRIPSSYVYRLPTEAEWEYACRAGIPLGDHVESHFNFRETQGQLPRCFMTHGINFRTF